MKRLKLLFILTIILSIQAGAQKTTPEEKSIVHKQFDENGNLIQYDSTFVWNWNSDSTFNFSFDENFAFGKDFPDIFKEFFTDTVFNNFGMPKLHQFPSFNHEDLWNLQPFLQDSVTLNEFLFENDSVFNFQFGQQFPRSFDFNEFEKLHKQFEERLKQHSFKTPDLDSEQREEWNRLIEKQQKEKEALLKKWEKKTE